MSSDEITIVGWSFALGLIVAYAMWIPARVWMLRQDLFEIRDRLWDQMRAKGMLDHPAHRAARTVINGHINFANALSTLSLGLIVAHSIERPRPNPDPFADAPEDVRQALHDLRVTVINYVAYRTLSGLVAGSVAFVLIVVTFGGYAAWKKYKASLDTLVEKLPPREIDAAAACVA